MVVHCEKVIPSRLVPQQMLLKVAKYLNILVVLLMTMDMVRAALTATSIQNVGERSYQSKHTGSSGISYILFEKEAEEESENSEEEREKFLGAELVDFSQVAILLAKIHASQVHSTPSKQGSSTHLALFTLYRVFLI